MEINLNQSLLTSPVLVQTPIVHVKIGDYEFGAYNELERGFRKYPNYVQSLEVKKINGRVNTYTLNLIYPITAGVDPNYFEKVFSSVSLSRRIEFTYGDASVPNYLYRNEVGIITKVTSNFQLDRSQISYNVTAISQAGLVGTGSYSFPATEDKPSNVIMQILKNPLYGLQDIFVGMQSITKVEQYGLIPHNDMTKLIQAKQNISVLEYLEYLVSLMTPSSGNSTIAKDAVYILTFVDDTTGALDGSYFKITEVSSKIEYSQAYQLDIGFPGSNYIAEFNVEHDENYSIFYNYQTALHPQEYVSRINSDGNYEEVYAPVLSSNNPQHNTEEDQKAWWAQVTNYPIKASVRIKGLLRPVILMTHVRLNITLYGQRHINSGLYIVTKQVDTINASGYSTLLNMVRIDSDSH